MDIIAWNVCHRIDLHRLILLYFNTQRAMYEVSMCSYATEIKDKYVQYERIVANIEARKYL